MMIKLANKRDMALSTIEKLRQGAGTFFGSFWNNCAASKIKSAGGHFEAETATSPSQPKRQLSGIHWRFASVAARPV
jgi:hypothetical protein